MIDLQAEVAEFTNGELAIALRSPKWGREFDAVLLREAAARLLADKAANHFPVPDTGLTTGGLKSGMSVQKIAIRDGNPIQQEVAQ